MPDLYRYFKDEHHAGLFADGLIRFTSTQLFRSIDDDARKDTSELVYRTLNNGIHTTKEIGNKIYSLSLSTKLSDELKDKFGSYVVQISNPQIFEELLSSQLQNSKITTFGGLICSPVSYYERTDSETLSFNERLFAKLSQFSNESEYRYLIIPRQDPASDFMSLDLKFTTQVIKIL